MESEFLFRILLPVLIAVFVIHRSYYTKKYGESATGSTLKKRDEGLASKLAALLGLVGFLATILYFINPGWVSWASLLLPAWARWVGVGVALSGFALLQWAQNTLGRNWSDTPRMMEEQVLVTSGPYRWVRHPIYTAFLLILGSSLLISSNALIGLAWAGMALIEIVSRIGFEEALMFEYFGKQYREYVKRTGRLFPKIG